VFARAKLSVNALGALVGLTEDLIAEIAEVAGVGMKLEIIDDFERRADYAREDIQLILGALSKQAL
jgi:imidazoleglycerol phosphate dehydratase HisB